MIILGICVWFLSSECLVCQISDVIGCDTEDPSFEHSLNLCVDVC